MRVIFGTGGTGGHLYPALALASYIQKQDPTSEFLFVGTPNHLEATVVPARGYAFEAMDLQGLAGSPIKKAKALLKFVGSLNKSKKIIRKFKPDIVVGFGGYVSSSIVLAASKLHIPTLIHEQNSIVGLANRMLIKHVDAIVACYEKAMESFPKEKTYLLGNPRASEVVEMTLTDRRASYGLAKDQPFVLIVMGSLGSSSVNRVIEEAMGQFASKPYDVVFVTGEKQYDRVMREVEEVSSHVKIVPYVDDLPGLMQHASLVVSRAGASTLAEITSLGVPALLIPSPYVASNHQEYNARELCDQGAACMILERELQPDRLVQTIDALLYDKQKLDDMRQRAKALGKPQASHDIYDLMLKVIQSR